jgi:hypothetical protein
MNPRPIISGHVRERPNIRQLRNLDPAIVVRMGKRYFSRERNSAANCPQEEGRRDHARSVLEAEWDARWSSIRNHIRIPSCRKVNFQMLRSADVNRKECRRAQPQKIMQHEKEARLFRAPSIHQEADRSTVTLEDKLIEEWACLPVPQRGLESRNSQRTIFGSIRKGGTLSSTAFDLSIT